MKHALSLGAADSYYSMLIYDFVKNAAQYSGENIDDMTDIGIDAPDDTTITITLAQKCPYFISLLSAGILSCHGKE